MLRKTIEAIGTLLLAMLATTVGSIAYSKTTASQSPVQLTVQDLRKDSLGDPLPELALLRIGTTRLQHGGLVQTLATSADGRFLASCGNDRVVRVWDAKDGKPLWRFELPHWGAWALAFSRDGKELAATSRSFSDQQRQGDFHRWDLKTGRALGDAKNAPPRFDSMVVSVALVCLPDGAYLVAETAGADVSLYAPGAAKAEKILRGHIGRVMSVRFTRDGETLVSLGDDGTIRYWNVADGKESAQLPTPAMKAHSLKGNTACIAVSTDAKTLAVSLPDQSSRILDAKGTELRRLPEAHPVQALEFSADGKSLFTGGAMVRCWQVATGQEIPVVSEPRHAIQALALAPDGKTVAFVDDHDTLRLADVATGKTVFHGKIACRAGIAFSAAGQYLATCGGDKAIALWDVAKLHASGNTPPGEPAAVFACLSQVVAFVFSADGKHWATAEKDGVARIYDIASKQLVFTLKSPGRAVGAVGFSANGELLWTMAAQSLGAHQVLEDKQQQKPNQVVRLWDAATGKEVALGEELRLTGHTVAFHPGGKALAAIHLPALAKLPPTGRIATNGDAAAIPVEDRMEMVRLWDIASALEKLRFEDPVQRQLAELATVWIIGRSRPQPAAFSPDGRLFAAPGPGGIVVFETASGKPRLRVEGHLQDVSAFAFTPDGRTLVSASSDATVLIWDLTGLKTTGKLPGTAEELWALLADANPERAGRAIWAMVDTPEESLRVLRQSLQPVPANPQLLQKLIADLDDGKFAVRDSAMRELAILGPVAEEALAARLRGGASLEMTQRIEKLLLTIRIAPASPQQLQVIRGVEVLERLGTPEARAWLGQLAAGAEGAWSTSQAKEALDRLNCR
jgi:WD40 repeat protein